MRGLKRRGCAPNRIPSDGITSPAPSMRGLKLQDKNMSFQGCFYPITSPAPSMRGLKLRLEIVTIGLYGDTITSPAPSMRGLKPRSVDGRWIGDRRDHIPCPVDEGIETSRSMIRLAPVSVITSPAPSMRGLKPSRDHLALDLDVAPSHPLPVDEGIETPPRSGGTPSGPAHHIPCPVDEGIETRPGPSCP